MMIILPRDHSLAYLSINQTQCSPIGYVSSARSVLAIGAHPDNPDEERVCALAKANMTDKSRVPTIHFRIDRAEVDHAADGSPIETSVVAHLAEIEGFDADQMLDIPSRDEQSTRSEAAEFLNDLLADGTMPSKEIKRLAEDADISDSTLHRARRRLSIVIETGTGRGGPTTWRLPCQSSPRTDDTKPEAAPDQAEETDSTVSCQAVG